MGYKKYKEGLVMIIEITDKAKSELKKIIESKNTNKPLRIFIASYG
jgi:Fe-S cluster assembly iron-binding protein IscA